MKLESITLSGFRSYREPVEISFSDGLTAIAGANGSGKSSIFDALMWALYGVGRGRIDEMVHMGESNMRVVVRFMHGDGCYMVERGVRFQPSGATVPTMTFRLVHGEAAQSDDLSGSTIRETQENVAKVLGPASVAFSTWYLAQGQAGAFFAAPPAERRDVLGTALGISGDWDALHSRASKTVAELTTAKHDADGDIRAAQGVLSATPAVDSDEIKRHDDEIEAMGRELEDLAADTKALAADREVAVAAVQDLEMRISKAQVINAAHAQWKARLLASKDQLDAARAELSSLRESGAEAMIAEAGKLDSEYDEKMRTFNARLRVWRERQALLQKQVDAGRAVISWWDTLEAMQRAKAAIPEHVTDAVCPTCNQPWTGASDHRARQEAAADRAIEAHTKEAPPGAEAEVSAESAKLSLKTAHAALEQLPEGPAPQPRPDTSAARKAEAAINRLDAEVQRVRLAVEGLAADSPEPQIDIAPLQETLTQLREKGKAIDAKRSDLRDTHADKRNEQAGHAKDVAELRYRQSQRADAEFNLKDSQTKAAALEARLQTVGLLYQAVSPGGTRQLILDTMIPRIEHEANLLLERIAPGTIVEFLTQRDSGTETIEIRAVDSVGYRRVDNMSGGERTRVMFAVRVAMSNVAAAAHGLASLPAFIIDESFADQDPQGRAAVIDCMTTLAFDVEQVLFISHDADLMEGTDQVIRLEKRDGVSAVVGK